MDQRGAKRRVFGGAWLCALLACAVLVLAPLAFARTHPPIAISATPDAAQFPSDLGKANLSFGHAPHDIGDHELQMTLMPHGSGTLV